MYWKVQLGPVMTNMGEASYSTCEEADTMDAAIEQARRGTIGKLRSAGAIAVAFSDIETANPLEAERLFLSGGDFNAYLKHMKRQEWFHLVWINQATEAVSYAKGEREAYYWEEGFDADVMVWPSKAEAKAFADKRITVPYEIRERQP